MLKKAKSLVMASLLAMPLLCTPPSQAQYDRDHHQNFYNGVREGGRGDEYNRGNDYRGNRGYDNRGHGIGTGTGALIGGAGGAALGAVFGGGLKGAIIGGAAGAGIGAVAGHEHQQNERRHDYERR